MKKLRMAIATTLLLFILFICLNIPSPDFEAHHSYVGRERWYQELNPLQRWLWNHDCGYEESCCGLGTSYGENHFYLISGLVMLLSIALVMLELGALVIATIIILSLLLTYAFLLGVYPIAPLDNVASLCVCFWRLK